MIKKKLNIAIFHLAFFYSGGGEKLVLKEIEGLQKQGHHVDCFVPTMNKKQCYPDIISKYPIRTFLPGFSKIFPNAQSLKILITCLFFPLVAKRFKEYDVIFGANQPGPWLAWIIKKVTGRPCVIYLAQPTRILYPRKIDREQSLWVDRKVRLLPLLVKIFKPVFSLADRISIKGADRVLANGSYIAGVLKRIYGITPIVCPAGAITVNNLVKERWTGLVRANGFKINKPYLLITNRHFPQKKFEYAIDAMPSVIEKYPDIKLVITGNNTPYTDYLKKIVKKMKISKNVLFTGYIKDQDLIKLYENAVVYVYTSPEEDFGMGVIEAMGAGVPVVAWNKAGPATTIIHNQTGILVKPFSQKEFTEGIVDLIKNINKNQILGESARAHVGENYTFQKHNDILEGQLIETAAKDDNH